MQVERTSELAQALRTVASDLEEIARHDDGELDLVAQRAGKVPDVGSLATALRAAGEGVPVAPDELERAVDCAGLVAAAGVQWRAVHDAAAAGDLLRGQLRDGRTAAHGIVVELWHDTTMWNEGFEIAQCPWLRVVVAAQDDADLLCQWVARHYTLCRWKGHEGLGFQTRQHPGAGPMVSLYEARWRVVTAVWGFDGP